MPRPRIELNDDVLLHVFSEIEYASDLAKLSLVCKRWRDLICAVSNLIFDFDVATSEELKRKEDIVSSMLCRAGSKAPGRLKFLRVAFYQYRPSAPFRANVRGHWLLYAPSLTILDLEIDSRFILEPVVWNSIIHMKHLEDLRFDGNFGTEEHLLLPRAPAYGLHMTRLQKCEFMGSVALLETILATCPALAEARFFCDKGAKLRVESNSLKIFDLKVENNPHEFKVTIDAPSLTTLILREYTTLISIDVESGQSLRAAEIYCPCKLHRLVDNLQELHVTWKSSNWDWLSEMLMLTPMITDLRLHIFKCEGTIPIDQVLAPLVNLKDIHFHMDAMRIFEWGQKRYDVLNVHLWPYHSPVPGVSLLKALVEEQKVQSLVVHCKEMLGYNAKTVKEEYREWQPVFGLSFFSPNLILDFSTEYYSGPSDLSTF